MASKAKIASVVTLLCEAYGRKAMDETFAAYDVVLREFSDDVLERTLMAVLRERREFMPPPGIVAGLAREVRGWAVQSVRDADDRRLVCLDCIDAGYLQIVNRGWLAAHRRQFTPEWFVDGWLREAELWCRVNARQSVVLVAVCSCDCHAAKTYRAQRDRYRAMTQEGVHDPKRNPPPSFGLARRCDDCLVPTKSSSDVREAILEWSATDFDAQLFADADAAQGRAL